MMTREEQDQWNAKCKQLQEQTLARMRAKQKLVKEMADILSKEQVTKFGGTITFSR